MGPVPGLLGISCMACMKIFDSFFACFSTLHIFIFLSQNTTQKGGPKVLKIVKNNKKTPTRSSLEIIPAKRISKVWKSYPLQRFKLISKGPIYPKKHNKLNPEWIRNCKLWSKWALKKTSKNKSLKSHQLYQNGLKLGTPGATKVQPNSNIFVTFCTPGSK